MLGDELGFSATVRLRGSATSVLGLLLKRHPKLVAQVVGWTASPNLWLPRASAVAFTPLVRRQQHLDTAYKVPTRLFDDRDDLMHMALALILREVGGWGMAASTVFSPTKDQACRLRPWATPSSASRERRGRPSRKSLGRWFGLTPDERRRRGDLRARTGRRRATLGAYAALVGLPTAEAGRFSAMPKLDSRGPEPMGCAAKSLR